MRKVIRWLAAGLFALLAATTLGYPLAAEGSNSASSELLVPTGLVGDDVSYSSFRRNNSQEPWKPAGAWSFRVMGHDTSLDQAAVLHDVAGFAVSFANWSGGPDPLTGERWDLRVADYLFVDLATRHAIQHTLQWSGSNSYLNRLVPYSSEENGLTNFGPVYPYSFGWLQPEASPVEFVSYILENQGAPLSVGQELDASSGHLLDLAWILREEGAAVENIARRVSTVGAIGGQEALVVRTEGCFRLDFGTDDAAVATYLSYREVVTGEPADVVPFLHGFVPLRSQVCFASEAWLSATSPYPLLVRESVDINGTPAFEWQDALSRVTPGVEPIRWGMDRAPHHYLEVNPFAEHCSESVRHPCEGQASWPNYRLGEARQAVEADPSLAPFQDWRRRGDVDLVGMWYAERTCSSSRWPCSPPMGLPPVDTAPTWLFIYGSPRGEYFAVYSVRSAPPSSPLNCATGPHKGPPFDPSQLVSPKITLDSALATWQFVFGEDAPVPTGFRWGADWFCMGLRQVPTWPSYRACDPRTDPRIRGVSGDGLTLFHQDDDEARSYAALGLSARTGNLEVVDHFWGHEFPSAFLGPKPLDAPPMAIVYGAGPGASPMPMAAAVGGALLAALAAVFAYPLIKFYGAHALTFLPGYAKLRRSEVLNNRIREQIHELIRNDPGISPPEIRKRVDAGWTTIVYHLRVLERNGLVSSLLDSRHRRYFPRETMDWNKRAPLAALRNSRTKAVYDLITREPGVHQREIARRVGVSQPGTAWHLERLRRTGLVESERQGRRLAYFPHAAPPTVREASGLEVA